MGGSMKVVEFFKARGIKPSVQRIRIYEYLLKYDKHPTVEDIYVDLLNEIPTISKTTIYNTLHLFLEKGIIKEISIAGDDVRYDAILDSHGHFKCEICGKLSNFPIEESIKEIQALTENKVNRCEIYLTGICQECLKERK